MLPPALALLAAALRISAASPVEDDDPQATATVTATPQVDPRLRVHGESVEPHAVQQGLELRVGQGWRRWSIDISDGTVPGQVQVQLRDEAGRIHTRALTLEGETVDERSLALASSLALLVEQLEDRGAEPPEPQPPEPQPPQPRSEPRTSGFIGVGPRSALNAGRPVAWDVGASVAGGTWLARDHVQPVAELAWARSTAGELKVDALRLGAGVLGGAAGPRGRLWGGGGAVVRAQWARARASATAAGWWASPAVMGAIQYRGRILVVGAWIGADLLLPPLRARGDSHVLRWSMVRPMATLHIGLRLPPRPRER
jgi:hypothetical protein